MGSEMCIRDSPEIIEGMKQLDLELYRQKVKESFTYFDDPEGILPETILHVLKRVHPTKESKLIEAIDKHKNNHGKITCEALLTCVAELYSIS